jgi:hypothetical protein
MADDVSPVPPAAVVKALKRFAAAHGGAEALVEYLGSKGARIVLAGADGGWGDQVVRAVRKRPPLFGGPKTTGDTPAEPVPDPPAGQAIERARAACEAAGITVKDGWEREFAGRMTTTGYEWGRMGHNHPVANEPPAAAAS